MQKEDDFPGKIFPPRVLEGFYSRKKSRQENKTTKTKSQVLIFEAYTRICACGRAWICE